MRINRHVLSDRGPELWQMDFKGAFGCSVIR